MHSAESDISQNGQLAAPSKFHPWYRSTEHASVKYPLLAYICRKYHVPPMRLLGIMYTVAHKLSLGQLDSRMDLTVEQKANRKSTIHKMLTTTNFLELIFYMHKVTS